MTPITRTLDFLLVTAAAAGLTGCDGGSPAASIAAAQQALAKGDANAAIIRAKTALQHAPQSAEARFVLGQALLASGDAAATATGPWVFDAFVRGRPPVAARR
jgi:cytochrome c-type biogenesis protein CcmH/NrfG